MISVNLTEQQLEFIYQLVGDKYHEVSTAWLPASETEGMSSFSYETLLNLRTALEGKKFDETYGHWDHTIWNLNKADYLRDVHLVRDEHLQQQGII